MKIRKDYVSNSSSCSFVIYIRDEKDIEQLKKHSDLMEKYAQYISTSYRDMPWGPISFSTIKQLYVGDFVSINVCEDNELDFSTQYPDSILAEVAAEFNEGAERELQIYVDKEAHYTIGDDYKEGK